MCKSISFAVVPPMVLIFVLPYQSVILVHSEFNSMFSSYFSAMVICVLMVQSTLVISTSVISNNPLSRRKNLVLVITQKSKIRL